MEKTITLPIDFLQRKQNAITVFIIIILIMFSLLSIGKCNAQDFNARARQFFVMDVVTGGIIGGVGSAFHPKQNEKRSHAFMQGFWKGCVGGSLTFTGKYMIYGVTKNSNLTYAWPAKIVHSVGASFMENAARNAAIYDNFALDYGALRVDVNYKGKVKIRAMPVALGGIVITALKCDKFSVIKTIQSGTPFFVSYNTNKWLGATKSDGTFTITSGRTYENSVTVAPTAITVQNFIFDEKNNIYNVGAHELIHVFQEREYLSMNNIYYKNKRKWIYVDFPAFDAVYWCMNNKNKSYYNNPFENQAETLSNRKFIY